MHVWHVPSGQRILVAKGYVPVFSPDGRRVAFRDAGDAIRLWDLSEREFSVTFDGSGNLIEQLRDQ